MVDDEACRIASKNEIIRRYYSALCDAKKGRIAKDVVGKLELLMSKAGISVEDRKAVAPALEKESLTGAGNACSMWWQSPSKAPKQRPSGFLKPIYLYIYKEQNT